MSRYSNDLIQFDIENKSLLNRDFILITLSSFIFFFNFHSFLLLPIRIQELGGSTSTIGFIMGATGLSTIFTTPAVGVLVDRWGKKRFLATGGLIMSLTTLPFAYLDTLNFLFPLLRMRRARVVLQTLSKSCLRVNVFLKSKLFNIIFGRFLNLKYRGTKKEPTSSNTVPDRRLDQNDVKKDSPVAMVSLYHKIALF